jgi:hypothetical protein
MPNAQSLRPGGWGGGTPEIAARLQTTDPTPTLFILFFEMRKKVLCLSKQPIPTSSSLYSRC